MTPESTPVYRDNANDAPPLRLHSADAVGVATFLGTPLAGSRAMPDVTRCLPTPSTV